MTRTEIYNCLRNLQVVPATSTLPEEMIAELVERGLVERKGKTKSIWLTTVGAHTKSGAV